MEPVLEPAIGYDAFRLCAVICARRGVPINSPEALRLLSRVTRREIKKLNASPIHIFGHRTEAMFYACVRALGKVKMIKREDGTECAAEDNAHLEIPDYRVVTATGVQLLIEVKNWHGPFTSAFTVGVQWMRAWRNYAKLTKASLKIAVYFSRYKRWVLLSPRAFQLLGNRYRISFVDAIKCNEMAVLGDVMVGSQSPLGLRIRLQRDMSVKTNDGEEIEGRITDAGFYCQDRRIIDPSEERIASLLMMYGGWPGRETVDLADPTAVTFICEAKPEQEVEDQGFQFCGSLSEMFSRWYTAVTANEATDQQPTQIYSRHKPVRFDRLIPEGYRGKDLPLWLFRQTPNFARVQTKIGKG